MTSATGLPAERLSGRSHGAAALVAALEHLGVEIAFGLPGAHNLAAWAAFAESSIRMVGVRHEQTAVYAADGHARTTGRLGVAFTTSGPGAANALGATGEAAEAGSPVVVIATDIATTLRRDGIHRGALHETRDQGAMFAPVVKQVLRVGRGDGLAAAVRTAAALALAPPTGPVYLEIPTDLLGLPDGANDAEMPSADVPQSVAPVADVAAAVRALDGARTPLIWAGGGAARSGAGKAVAALAGRLGAPVIETYMGRGLIEPTHPAWVGVPPHVPEAGALWDAADVVLAVGTDFDGMMTQNWRMPQPPCLIAVNVAADEAMKNYPADLVLAGDAREVVERLARGVADRGDPGALRARLETVRAAAARGVEKSEPQAAELLASLRSAVGPRTAVFADMCVPGYWAAGFHPFADVRRLAYPVGWGTLGFAFPASLGAALSGPDPVLCICGDGGFLFAAGELATAAQERAPVTVLLVDDGGYGMLRFDQHVAGQAPFGVDLQTPDWVALAGSFGVRAREVDGLGEPLAEALEAELATDEPSMIVARARLMPPPTTSPRWYRASTTKEKTWMPTPSG
jgi:thiamine pyrophosphate-dependent acetolactate synthase large subunit-like protein